MKTERLITALKSGKILAKIHNEDDTLIEFLFHGRQNEHEWLEMKGWGTAIGTTKDRLENIYFYPNDWRIIKNFNMNTDNYPYPWSSIETVEYEFED